MLGSSLVVQRQAYLPGSHFCGTGSVLGQETKPSHLEGLTLSAGLKHGKSVKVVSGKASGVKPVPKSNTWIGVPSIHQIVIREYINVNKC